MNSKKMINVISKIIIFISYVNRKTLCTTLAGNFLDYLTIADSKDSSKEVFFEFLLSRKYQGVLE